MSTATASKAGATGKKSNWDAKRCITHEFRLSFPQLHEPKSFNGSKEKYSLVMLFPKSTNLSEPSKNGKGEPTGLALKQAALNAAVEKWGADKTQWPKNLRLPWHDGDEKSERDGYAGHIYITATSLEQPGMVDQSRQPMLNPQKDLYAGCYARAELIAFAYDTAGNRGVSFGVRNIQKLRDGERFSGRKDAADVFDSVEDASENAENYGGGGATDNYGF